MKAVCALFCVSLAIAAAVDICPQIYAPECGADGKVYDNDCLRGVARVGKADNWEACRGHPLCPAICTMEWNPVCANNRQIYGNKCEMQSKNCGKLMFVLPRSECGIDE